MAPHGQDSQVLLNANTDPTRPSISPAPLTAAKPTYLQQPVQQQSQILPLGSPAAGTLPPTANSMAPNSNTAAATNSGHKQSIDYKPYKPKFHNASLYNTTKEAAAAAAASAVTSSTTSTPNASILMSSTTLTTTTMQQHNSPVIPAKEMSAPVQKLTESPHVTVNHHQQPPQQQQHLIMANEQKMLQPTGSHLPPPPPQQSPPNHMPHHPSLSPSTQMKLNNHISAHQMHQLQQQQLQQLQAQAAAPPPHHHMLGPPPPASALSLPLAAAYYLGTPPGTPAALLHPASHLPAQPFYSPVFASLQMMTPQQQQQFQHQLQIQQQHLQQQQQLQQQLTHSSIAAAIPPPPQPTPPMQSPHSSQTSPSLQSPMHLKQPNPLTNANSSRGIHHPKANTPSSGNSTLVHPTPQNPLHYLANAASVAPVALANAAGNTSKNSAEMVDQSTGVISQRSAAHVSSGSSSSSSALLQTSANSGMQEVTLVSRKYYFILQEKNYIYASALLEGRIDFSVPKIFIIFPFVTEQRKT